MEKLKSVLNSELNRCVELLPNTDPTTEAYRTLLINADLLNDYLCDWFETCQYKEYRVPDRVGPKVVITPVAEPVVEEPAPAPAPGPAVSKEEVRAQLAEARLKGVNITALIEAVGASNLSGVDPARYGELQELARKAVEELG